MYETTKSEVKILIEKYGYDTDVIPLLEIESDKVRKGMPVDLFTGISVAKYQSALQKIRKANKKWWMFWR